MTQGLLPEHTAASTLPTLAPTPEPGGRPRRLSAPECWSRLRQHSEGRLGYLSGRGPRQVVVPYTVWDRRVVLRLPEYHEAARYLTDRPVTFAVVERVGRHAAERVEVVARARLSEAEGGVLSALPDEHWPVDLPSRLVWLDVDDVSGETEPDAGRRADVQGSAARRA
jgi:hypothetical protein